MKKVLIVAVCLLFIVKIPSAQEVEDQKEKEKGFQKERLFVGGNFGLTFGNYSLINISPQIGYRFSKYLAAGTGVNFQYISLKQKDSNGDIYHKTSQGVTGLNVFGRVYPVQQFMLQVQPEVNYVFGNDKYFYPNRVDVFKLKEIVPSMLLGGGLVLPSGRGAFIASLFYDVLNKTNSPYGNRPIINFTYNVGL